jgi:TetR/AcrR family fatty acid metabolism transcriptional regulator
MAFANGRPRIIIVLVSFVLPIARMPGVRTKTPLYSDKMLEAAGRLFGTRRFHEVRMEDVASEADVSKGTLYRYFRDKEEMYLAMLARASLQFVTELRAGTDAAHDPRAKLIAVVDAIVSFFDRQPHLFDLIQRAEIRRELGAAFPWQQARDETLRIVQDIFAQGRRTREFAVRRPDLAALMLLGGLRAVIRFSLQPRTANLAADIVDDFLCGAAAPAADHVSVLSLPSAW